jgi:DNA repair exonuclease SbcCD ATPase subunit
MQNKILQNEKEYLIKELNTSKNHLQQTQKELAEANNLLLDTRVEMNNWKADILGFREEMRQAEIAQLQSLKQILEVLGGETPSQVAAAEGQ